MSESRSLRCGNICDVNSACRCSRFDDAVRRDDMTVAISAYELLSTEPALLPDTTLILTWRPYIGCSVGIALLISGSGGMRSKLHLGIPASLDQVIPLCVLQELFTVPWLVKAHRMHRQCQIVRCHWQAPRHRVWPCRCW